VGNVILPEKRAGGAGPAGDVEAGFDSERNSLQCTWRFPASETRFCFARAGPGGFGVNVHEGIQLRLNLLDAAQVPLNEFDRREFFASEFFQGFGDGEIERLGHGTKKEVSGTTGIRQGKLEKQAKSRYKIG